MAREVAEALHRAFHDAWPGPSKSLNLYVDSAIWDKQAEVVDRLIAEAEQRGREDNADHGMCYVHGSKALEALIAEAEERGAARVRERVEAAVDQWLAGTHDAAACQDFGCKDCVVVACDFDIRAALGGTP